MSLMSGASTYAVGQVARGELEDSGDLTKIDMSKAKNEFKAAFEKGNEFVSNLDKNQDSELRELAVAEIEELTPQRDEIFESLKEAIVTDEDAAIESVILRIPLVKGVYVVQSIVLAICSGPGIR